MAEEVALRNNVLEIRTEGVKNILRSYDEKEAICEYVWNGFDANAKSVNIEFVRDDTERIRRVVVSDDGFGIDHSELHKKFKWFYETEKRQVWDEKRTHSLPRGRTGVGRLTFISLANQARWDTIYEKDRRRYRYEIKIDGASLREFSGLDQVPVQTMEPCGTSVELTGVSKDLSKKEELDEVIQHIKREFGWFLELTRSRGFSVLIDGTPLDYSSVVGDSEAFAWEIDGRTFRIRYVRWNVPFNGEYSRNYYLDSKGEEVYKKTTGLNKQGDEFYHSVFLESDYFDNFNFENTDDEQTALDVANVSSETFKRLTEKVVKYLKKKRKAFLKKGSNKIIEDYQEQGIIPAKVADEFERVKNDHLKKTVKELYVVQPSIFSNLNGDQKRILVGFLSLILDTDEREGVLEIISQIVELEPEERAEFRELLRETRLSYITSTMNMIIGRRKKMKLLEDLVFSDDFKAKESHIQDAVESMTWLFGEQYAVLGSMEDDFESLLRNLREKIDGVDEKIEITDPDKHGQVDILLFRKQIRTNEVNNIIIELKAPTVKIGDKQLQQIERYAKVIKKEPRFSSPKSTWDFILIGRDFSLDSTLDQRFDSARIHGERGLIAKFDGIKIYVKKWSELFDDFEIRHNFLYEKLAQSRSRVGPGGRPTDADEVVDSLITA